MPPPEDPSTRREVDAIAKELDAIGAARIAGTVDGLDERSVSLVERGVQPVTHPRAGDGVVNAW